MEIEQVVWGFTPERVGGEGGGPVILYTLTNRQGASVQLTNYGASVVGISVPDRRGEMADVVLGYGRWEDYVSDGPAMGKSVGRYANRIARGVFSLPNLPDLPDLPNLPDGETSGVNQSQTYRLAVNNGPNHLHGGPMGFQNQLWEGRVEGDRVVFGYRSEDGDQGYPGALYVEACFDWGDDNRLEITYFAQIERVEGGGGGQTIVNLTNHVYFNLNGHDRGDILDHELTLHASKYLPTDNTAIPLAEAPVDVAGSPMDFRLPHSFRERIDDPCDQLIWGKGYDHCWVIDGYPRRGGDGRGGDGGRYASVLENQTLLAAGELYSPDSGRCVRVETTQPGIQVYTGNWLAGCAESKSKGFYYGDRFGVALECQGWPDSPNRPDFPSTVLKAGEVYRQRIVYQFGTK